MLDVYIIIYNSIKRISYLVLYGADVGGGDHPWVCLLFASKLLSLFLFICRR